MTLGTKFLKKFIDMREKNPSVVTDAILDFLDKHKVSYEKFEADKGLLPDFFGQNYIIHINPMAKYLQAPLLVGKGVCFDTGGYNIKTGSYMKGMHYDKTGAILAIAAAIDHKVSAAVFFVNNMIDYRAPVEGDILTETGTGLKVLIDNTDAEGRIGLAHLLATIGYKYDSAITIATLTGAAIVALGERTYAAVHSYYPDNTIKSTTLKSKLLHAAIIDGAEFWPLPEHAKYDKAINTKVKGADVRNCGDFKGAGSQTAFSFLKRFTKKPLLHLDIAGMDTDANGNGNIWGLKEVGMLLKILKSVY